MSKLLVEVKCGTEACGDCEWLASLTRGEWLCQMFDEALADTGREDIMPPRSAMCLAAERAVPDWERRYGELVETVAKRTDQAKGAK